VKNDVFLKALLETPTTEQGRRSPLQWAGGMVLHVVIIAALIIVPLYITGTIHLNEYNEVPLVAPPPLAPPPAPAAGAVAPHITHPKERLNYTLQKLTVPTAIPKNVSVGSENAAEAPPDLGGVPGGVPGGVIGGALGGVLGGTGTALCTADHKARFGGFVIGTAGESGSGNLPSLMTGRKPRKN
jgi:periplasmic protein TonB